MQPSLNKILIPFMIPALIPFILSTEKLIIFDDVRRWSDVIGLYNKSPIINLLYLLQKKEFRSLYYYRIKHKNFIGKIATALLGVFLKQEEHLFIWCDDIGSGLFIQHGFSTVISAKSIGKNCWINQQVTIGNNGKNINPTIGSNVWIRAGAKVIGGINIGDNVVIGANAVVVKDVPPNCVVVGVPAYIIKRDGIRVYEKLV
jgi:serine O-acetyltransferase